MSVAKAKGWGTILEDLKSMRDRIHYRRKMNRRLHAIPFIIRRRLRGCLSSMLMLAASSLCPVWWKDGKASNGHRMLRCGCGYENDRDVTACLNLLRRNPRCGELPFPPNP